MYRVDHTGFPGIVVLETVALTVEDLNDELEGPTELCGITLLVNIETTNERVREVRGHQESESPERVKAAGRTVLTDVVLDVGELPLPVPDGFPPRL